MPKLKYESKVENIMNNTKLDRKDAILPKKLREARDTEKVEKEKRKQSRKERRAAEREEKKKEPKIKVVDNVITLFVRNIPFDIDEVQF